MPKARRRLSDLVLEETQKVRETNLQSSEVTIPKTLPEVSSQTNLVEEIEPQTANVTDLQTLENSEFVSAIAFAAEEKGNEAKTLTELQKSQFTNLQTSEVTNTPEVSSQTNLVEQVTEQQIANVTNLQTLEVSESVPAIAAGEKGKEVKSITEVQSSQGTNLQTSEVTSLKTLPEVSSQTNSVEEVEPQTTNVTDLQTLEISESVPAIAAGEKGNEVKDSTKIQRSQDTDLQSKELPKYLKLERKEARLRQDQIDELTDLTRKLNRMKRGKGGERLTDNTLIRVAIDLLLSKASSLQGTTEEELLRSLNL